MKNYFTIPEHRLGELKQYIKEFTPSVRFLNNPLKIGNKYHISLSMEVEDGNKLNILHNKWYKQDNPPIITKEGVIKRIINKLFN